MGSKAPGREPLTTWDVLDPQRNQSELSSEFFVSQPKDFRSGPVAHDANAADGDRLQVASVPVAASVRGLLLPKPKDLR